MTTADTVERALIAAGVRHVVESIADDPTRPGEVVMCIAGRGRRVHNVRDAIRIAEANDPDLAESVEGKP